MSKTVNILVTNINPDIRDTIQELRNIRSRNIKIWIPSDVLAKDKQYNQSALMPLEKNINPDKNLTCYRWNINNSETLPIEELYLYWIKRYDDSQEWVILTESQYPKQSMNLFLDALHIQNLPERWYKYKCFSSREQVISFCKEVGAICFALCENARFSIAYGISSQGGAKVYIEKETGYLWYLDKFHNDHCEVFDSTGKKHIGVADISTGEIDPSKAVKGRMIMI